MPWLWSSSKFQHGSSSERMQKVFTGEPRIAKYSVAALMAKGMDARHSNSEAI